MILLCRRPHGQACGYMRLWPLPLLLSTPSTAVFHVAVPRLQCSGCGLELSYCVAVKNSVILMNGYTMLACLLIQAATCLPQYSSKASLESQFGHLAH